MCHHGDTELDEPGGELDLRSLELDCVRAPLLEEASGVPDAFLDRHLIREERHVATPCYGLPERNGRLWADPFLLPQEVEWCADAALLTKGGPPRPEEVGH